MPKKNPDPNSHQWQEPPVFDETEVPVADDLPPLDLSNLAPIEPTPAAPPPVRQQISLVDFNLMPKATPENLLRSSTETIILGRPEADPPADPPVPDEPDKPNEPDEPTGPRQPTGPPPPPEPPAAAAAPLTDQAVNQRLLAIVETLVQQRSSASVVPIVQAPPGLTPEQGARALFPLLNEGCINTLTQIADTDAHGSVAMVICGVLMQLQDRGDLRDMMLNPDWAHQVNQPVAGPQVFGGNAAFLAPQATQAICQYCHHGFKPPLGTLRPRFCCNACGNLAAGYAGELYPHRPGCTTEPGVEQDRLLASMKKNEPKNGQVLDA